MRKITLFMLFVLLMSILAACTKKDETVKPNEPSAVSPQKQEPVELRIAWWGGQARHDMYNKLFDLFQEKYPNITVSREFTGENQYVEKFTTQAAGGNAPDVMQTSSFFQSDFVSRNMMMDLDPLVASGDLNTKDFDPVAIEGGKVNGKLYAISLGHNITGVIHNTEMFKKAGVDLPKNNWSRDDFFKTAQALQKSLGTTAWATEDEGGTYRGFEMFAQQRGKSVFKDAGLGVEKQDLVDWYTFWDKMRKAGRPYSRKKEIKRRSNPCWPKVK
jgi:multiple sugar transport system substrate-binding protein